jgi:hypothetical protein
MAAEYDITIRQGSTFLQNLIWKDSEGVPVDLTGYTARMQIRQGVCNPDVIVELTTENDRITLGGVAGTIVLEIDADTTAAITAGCGLYDLELESSSGFVTAILYGAVTFEREVTR